MGNQPSNPQSPIDGRNRPNGPAHHHHKDFNPGRRQSVPGLSVKASAAPPQKSVPLALAQTPHPPKNDVVVANTLRDSLSQRDHPGPPASAPPNDKMGAEQSRQAKRDNREKQPKSPRSVQQSPSPSPQQQSRPVQVPAAPPREDIAAAVQVSGRPEHTVSDSGMAAIEAAMPAPMEPISDYFVATQQFARPPRLPLPIEEEVHTPGSPIISPEDVGPLDIETDGDLPRPTPVLSSTTLEDEELGDDLPGRENVPTVPTLIEWEGPGDRVYVTGTFVEWNRKFRLHRNGPSKKKDVLSAIVNITPGTHHLKFIVDDNMTTSDKLPTAVDYTNILVNYLEVSLDDVPKTGAVDASKLPQPATVQELRAPPGIYPPQTLPPTPELIAQQIAPKAPEPTAPPVPLMAGRYHSVIPRYLLDLDAPEESRRFMRASAATSSADSLPPPPSLPMFLNKSILNGTTPMKDDSSVLNMPNHTVLNHLATSSIKDNILATSATTRYKQKFLTTIMYKPKGEDHLEAH